MRSGVGGRRGPAGRRGARPRPDDRHHRARPGGARRARLGATPGAGPAGRPLAGPLGAPALVAAPDRGAPLGAVPDVRDPRTRGPTSWSPTTSLARLGVARSRGGTGCRCWCGPSTRRGRSRYWLDPGRAWLVTTNEPELALAIRRRGPDRMRAMTTDSPSTRCPRRAGRALPRRDHRRCRPTTRATVVATLVTPGAAGRRPRRCCTCTASPTTSSRPSTPSGGPSAATTSTRSTCASTAARCARTRRPNYVTDLREHFPEIDAAWHRVTERDGHDRRRDLRALDRRPDRRAVGRRRGARPSWPGWC